MTLLTPKRLEILQFIRDYIERYQYPPTVREIGKGVGLSSSSTIMHHLVVLSDARYLKWKSGNSRTLVLTMTPEGDLL